MKKYTWLKEDTPLAIIKENKREKKVKEDLIALLKDDGKGHKHGVFAKVLSWYTFQIVPTEDEPTFTASADYQNGIISVGEGFLLYDDERLAPEIREHYLSQLSVLLRHEIAHNLLEHQTRIALYLKNKGYDWERMMQSNSLHSIANILMDFDISNTRYTDEDKEKIKNLLLNGEIIHALVTEEHRPDWTAEALEAMYDSITQEVAQQKYYAKQLIIKGRVIDTGTDTIANSVLRAKTMYSTWDSEPLFDIPWHDIVESKLFKRLSTPMQDIFNKLYAEIVEQGNLDAYTDDILKKWYLEIADSGIWDQVDLVSPVSGELFGTLVTPEDKYLIQEVFKHFKIFRSAYSEWYYKTVYAMREPYTKDDVKTILDALRVPD